MPNTYHAKRIFEQTEIDVETIKYATKILQPKIRSIILCYKIWIYISIFFKVVTRQSLVELTYQIMSKHTKVRMPRDKYAAFRSNSPFSLFVAMDPVYKVPLEQETSEQDTPEQTPTSSSTSRPNPTNSRLTSYGVIGSEATPSSPLPSYASIFADKDGQVVTGPSHSFMEWVGVEKKYVEAKKKLEAEQRLSQSLRLKYQEAQRQLEKITKEYSQLYAWSQNLSNARVDVVKNGHDRQDRQDRPSYRQSAQFHSKKYFRCYVCHRSFYSQVELDEHCLGDGHFCCRTCTQRSGGKHCLFSDRQQLVKHLKTTHPPYE
jgi:hypothetical protein